MKRLLAALLLVASPVLAQATNGWAEIQNGWGEIQNPPGFDTIPAPTGCATTELAYFLGSPATMACLDQVYWTAATRSLDVTDGRVQAANLKAIGLATPGAITVTPTLTQVGSITTVAGSALVDGDYFTIKYDGGGVVPIEFDLSPGDGTTGGRIPLLFTAADSADLIRDNVILALNAAAPTKLTATSGGAATVALVLDTPGADASATPNTEDVGAAGFAVTGFANPTAATTVTYKLVACLSDSSCTEAGAASSTAASTATLSASNYLRLTWSAVSGAVSYKVYRTVAPTSPATTGLIYSGALLALSDTGLAGGGETAPAQDTTGLVSTDGLRVGTSATIGHVLTADANGYFTAQAPSALSGLTATRVPFAASATSLEDDANFAYNKTTDTLSLTSTTMATDGTGPVLKLVGTLPAAPSTAVSAMTVTATSAGSAAQDQRGTNTEIAAGYTGTKSTIGARMFNSTAGRGVLSDWTTTAGNYGFLGGSSGVTVGHNVGAYGFGYGSSTLNLGVLGRGAVAASGDEAVGVAGIAMGTGTDTRVGGYFGFASTAVPTAAGVAALMADNGTDAANIAAFKDNGVTKVSILDGGVIELEGATDDTSETTLAVEDPTADRTVTIPNASGTIALVSYGDLYYDGDDNNDGTVSETTVTINAADTYYQLVATTAGTTAGDVTCSASTDDCSVSAAGTYRVSGHVSYKADTSGGTKGIIWAAFKEGSIVSKCKFMRDVTSTSTGSGSFSCIVAAAANDSFDLRVMNATDDIDVTVSMAQLVISRVGN